MSILKQLKLRNIFIQWLLIFHKNLYFPNEGTIKHEYHQDHHVFTSQIEGGLTDKQHIALDV